MFLRSVKAHPKKTFLHPPQKRDTFLEDMFFISSTLAQVANYELGCRCVQVLFNSLSVVEALEEAKENWSNDFPRRKIVQPMT